jgi:transcriptional regulator with XRE-family HTH domain
MSDMIRSARQRAGLSMADFAAQLGVSESAISQMERSEREGTIRVTTMNRALEALGHDLLLTSTPRSRLSRYAPARLAHDVAIALGKADKPTALRLLTQSAEYLRDSRDSFDPDEIQAPPARLPDLAWDAFARALYRRSLGADAPTWTKAKRLPQPTYLLDEPSFRARADNAPDLGMKRLNILVDERSFSRA